MLDCKLKDRWGKCRNEFDMAALCYDHIAGNIGSLAESVFISQYMDEGEKNIYSNPNIPALRKLINSVKTILYNEPVPDIQVSCVWECIEQMDASLIPFEDRDANSASVFMAVLMGIDLHILERKAKKYTFPSNGPLNTPHRAESLVYLKNEESLLNTMSSGYQFRKGVSSGGVGDVLTALLLIKKTKSPENCEYPQIKPLYIHEGRTKLRNQLRREKKLRIAIIPDSRPRPFSFAIDDMPGSSFCVRYAEEQSAQIQNHCEWLRSAVEKGANLVVYPEFYISPEILDGIKKWLAKNAGEKWMKESALIAVYAGSSWDKPDNNVMHILDWRGNELGTYYKYSPFTSVPPDTEDSDTYKMCENLTSPGEKSLMLDVEFVGRILPAICRDVIDGLYTERLVNDFKPFMLMTSAYSSSVASFHRHYISYASRYYVTSVLCNACDAAKGKSLDLCTVPIKEQSEMGHLTEEILKCYHWKGDCPGSCCIMLEVDYKKYHGIRGPKGPHISYVRYKNKEISVANSKKK